MTKRIFLVTETENAADPGFDEDDWGSRRARDAEEAAELFAERLNRDAEGDSDDRTFDISVKSEDGSVKRFVVHASMTWSYSTTEKGGAT